MVLEARGLEAFLQTVKGAEELARKAGDLAGELESAGILKITRPTPTIELPQGIRTETLKIGHRTKQDALQEVGDQGIRRSSYANDLIDRIKFSDKADDIRLIWASGRDLGLTRSAPYSRFLEAGQARGYNKVSPEVAVYLRLQDMEQPLNDWYWMAMDPMTDRDGHPDVFELGRYEDGLWLRADWTDPGSVWYPEARFVFGLSK